jgi:hypothetical protein
MIKHGIKESFACNLSTLWNYGEELSHIVVVADKKKRFLEDYNRIFLSALGCQPEDYVNTLVNQIAIIEKRGLVEKTFWENEKTNILQYSRKQAIKELIRSKKIEEKIQQIEQYVEGLRND